jgi:hypothetical protein
VAIANPRKMRRRLTLTFLMNFGEPLTSITLESTSIGVGMLVKRT